MKKIMILKGLQGSGKSYWAREFVIKNPNWKRINRDSLRDMIDAGIWSESKEKYIRQAQLALAKLYSDAGFNLIIDDTNLSDSAQNMWKQFAKDNNLQLEEKFFDTPLEECIARDLRRANSVGEKVIRSTYNKYLAPKPEVYVPPEGKPQAVLCDLDGTLCKMSNRSPYAWHQVGEDTVNDDVAEYLQHYGSQDVLEKYKVYIILMSGRDSVCRPETEKWLADNHIAYDYLFMRPEGNKEKDSIVKRTLFDEHIRDSFNIKLALDDRDQVVNMYRNDLGLTVWQVAPGDF